MKLDLGKILGAAALVQSFVQATQEKLRDKSGAEKKAVVVEQVKAVLPIVEGVSGVDLFTDATFVQAIDDLIAAEKAVLKARATVAALIADAKRR